MPAVQSTLFSRFPKADIPCIRLPKAVVAEVIAAGPKMEKMHNGRPDIGPPTSLTPSGLRVCGSATDDEKMVAYASDGKLVALLFGRMGPSNFAESHLEIMTAAGALRVFCTEQLFMLLKACSVRNCPNFVDCAKRILLAAQPRFAKSVGRDVQGLIPTEWDSQSELCMFAAILFACTNEATFLRYQGFVAKCPCPEMAALIAEGKFRVYECNDDRIWGIYMFTRAVLNKLAELEPGVDLEQAMADLSAGTTNQLGRVLAEFLLAIRDMTYAQYMQEVGGISFFEEVDDQDAPVVEEEESIDSPPTKRQCSVAAGC